VNYIRIVLQHQIGIGASLTIETNRADAGEGLLTFTRTTSAALDDFKNVGTGKRGVRESDSKSLERYAVHQQ
jgi:hypothetical protein